MKCKCRPFVQHDECDVHPTQLGPITPPRGGLPQLMYSGTVFWPLDPRADEVLIGDIAHHLSNLCRFTGGTRWNYSVAQHSCHVHDVLLETTQYGIAAWGLLHDAPEAYAGDVARPLKYAVEGFGEAYRKVEDAIMRVIVERFDLQPEYEPDEVKVVDDRLLATELRDLMPSADHPAFNPHEFAEPYRWRIEQWSPARARAEFLDRFYRLVWDGIVKHEKVAA